MNIIFLDGNNLTGTIPKAFANMKNLAELNLLANRLSGTIPVGMQSKPWELISLGCNALTGAIPAMDFQSMKECDLGDDPTWCAKSFGQQSPPSNRFSCPLPAGAAQTCNAKCT